jgi:hypothetical protein
MPFAQDKLREGSKILRALPSEWQVVGKMTAQGEHHDKQ